MGGKELVVDSDHELARFAALEAGRMLLALRSELGFEDPKRLRDQGDRTSHELLMKLLEAQRPDDAVLSEEGIDDRARIGAKRVWIVDPLDGTREYGEEGRTDWAVHVALIEDGDVVASAVALPARDLVMTTLPAPQAPQRASGRLRLIVSRSHTPPEALLVAAELDAELVYMGSAGAKTMAVVMGDADAYRPPRRSVRVGFGGSGGSRDRRGAARDSRGRLAASLQPRESVAPRSGRVPRGRARCSGQRGAFRARRGLPLTRFPTTILRLLTGGECGRQGTMNV